MNCRNCQAELTRVFVDLGTSPLSNAYVRTDQLDEPEPHFPLRPYICDECLLVQLPVFETPEEIFGDYAFFSGQSQTWVKHCDDFATKAVQRFRPERVLELASNDGTMLRAFQRWDVTATGVEPARNVARQALLEGLPTIDRFFTSELADELVADGYRADLIVANNVLAHVPDLDDFIGGIKTVLAPDGVVSIEVPSLVKLIEGNQFDTIYHEHFSYFTLRALCDVLYRRGLYVFDLEELPTHGGSLRVYAQHYTGNNLYSSRLNDATTHEVREGFAEIDAYLDYAHKPAELKQRMMELLTGLRREGKHIAGYGAPAKATTFLSYCGIGPETIEFIVDSTPSKQGKYLPGARIPIFPPEHLTVEQPDVIVILPWNWKDEIAAKIERDCDWNPMVLCRDEVLSGGLVALAA
jgi:SAM-dependent methyltransferase